MQQSRWLAGGSGGFARGSGLGRAAMAFEGLRFLYNPVTLVKIAFGVGLLSLAATLFNIVVVYFCRFLVCIPSIDAEQAFLGLFALLTGIMLLVFAVNMDLGGAVLVACIVTGIVVSWFGLSQLGKNDALTGCMFPVEEICQPTEEYPQGEPPSWTGCQIAYEDRPQ